MRARTNCNAVHDWLGWVLLRRRGVRPWSRLPAASRSAWVAATSASSAWCSPWSRSMAISAIGADSKVDGAAGPWQNLGAGGWMACPAVRLLGGAGFIVATATGRRSERRPGVCQSRRILGRSGPPPVRDQAALPCSDRVALFYPPTTTEFWQTVLVTEIGIYVLLAIGLNVVVGWAGLLDLGFIAFYAIGSYTTAYSGRFAAGQAAVVAAPQPAAGHPVRHRGLSARRRRARRSRRCGCAATTWRSSRSASVRSSASSRQQRRRLTNGTRGRVACVPHPVIHLGPISITWGLNQLQYWYLLLVLIVIVVIAFNRLENFAARPRLGRDPRGRGGRAGHRHQHQQASSCWPSRSVPRPPVWPACSSPARSASSPRTTSS